MTKADYIRVIEIDAIVYELQRTLKQFDYQAGDPTLKYITDRIIILQTEKQKLK